ncbi:MAG: sigma-54-dependent Fis family transcriptional regulator [Chloroflexi bacterium]|nr:sigma-54-dependent Fis family transcriptional regulator [Chloroflexota bacterium]
MNGDIGKILIVDDEEGIRRLCHQALEGEGFLCETASNGQEALARAAQEEFDLVLLDVKMPGMSGLEVLPRLNTAHPDTCVVMVTAMVDAHTAVQAMRLGAYDYLTKPFDIGDLISTAERALERRRLSLENKRYQERLEQMVQEQARQIRAQFREIVQALLREQITLQELEAIRRATGVEATQVSSEIGKPVTSVKEFATHLIKLIDTKLAPTH